MTGIHPIQSFKEMPRSKKIATVAATTAAVSLTAAAAIIGKGKTPETKGVKLFNNIMAGYSFLAGGALHYIGKAARSVGNFISKGFKAITSKFQK